ELLGEVGLMLGTQRGEEVELLRLDLLARHRHAVQGEVARARELLDLGFRDEVAVLPELDFGQLEGVEAQLDLLADEEGIDAVAVALERDRGGARDGAFLAPQERLA